MTARTLASARSFDTSSRASGGLFGQILAATPLFIMLSSLRSSQR
jgi:hypothetical protein